MRTKASGGVGRSTKGRKMATGEEKELASISEDEPLLLTTRQAAKYLGINEERVRELTAQKRHPLPAIWLPRAKYPRYTKEILKEYVCSLAVAGIPGQVRR